VAISSYRLSAQLPVVIRQVNRGLEGNLVARALERRQPPKTSLAL